MRGHALPPHAPSPASPSGHANAGRRPAAAHGATRGRQASARPRALSCSTIARPPDARDTTSISCYMSGVPGASALALHSQSESASDTGNDGAKAACQRSDARLQAMAAVPVTTGPLAHGPLAHDAAVWAPRGRSVDDRCLHGGRKRGRNPALKGGHLRRRISQASRGIPHNMGTVGTDAARKALGGSSDAAAYEQRCKDAFHDAPRSAQLSLASFHLIIRPARDSPFIFARRDVGRSQNWSRRGSSVRTGKRYPARNAVPERVLAALPCLHLGPGIAQAHGAVEYQAAGR